MQLGQIKAQRDLGLPGQRQTQRLGADIRVAVAVAADPAAHAQERRHRLAGQQRLDLAVELGDLAQKGALVVRQRVLDLVADAELGVAQHPCLPQLGDAPAQHLLVLGQLARCVQGLALADQVRYRAFGVEDAFALHLGRVGGQHRRDVGPGQRCGDLRVADVGLVQALEGQRQ